MTYQPIKVKTDYLGVSHGYLNSKTKEVFYQGEVSIKGKRLYTAMKPTPKGAAIEIDKILLKNGKEPRILKKK